VNAGPLEALRAARRLADCSTCCPVWCDHQHDLTGDDRGIDHECVVIGPSEDGPIEAYLRVSETVDAPGVLGPITLAIFTTEHSGDEPGWYLSIPVDDQFGDVRDAVQQVMKLVGAWPPASESVPLNADLDNAVVDLVSRTDMQHLALATG
jgi:hypothetical protein